MVGLRRATEVARRAETEPKTELKIEPKNEQVKFSSTCSIGFDQTGLAALQWFPALQANWNANPLG